MLKNECQAGCMVFTGGDIYHHKDCVNYSESMSQMLDELKEQVKNLSLGVVSGSLLPEELKYQKDLISELINMHEHPEDSNKEWKETIISTAREKGYGNAC